jgi:hypothetical protein
MIDDGAMNTRTDPVPPPALRFAHVLTLGCASSVTLAVAVALLSGTATPGLVGWGVVAVAGLTFFSASTRTGRRWAAALLPVTVVATLGSAILETLPPQAPVGPPLWLIAAGALPALTACALFGSATNWFRDNGDLAQALPRRTRKTLLGVHVIASLVWCGVICTTAVLAVTAALSTDPATVAALVPAMVVIDDTLLGPPALLALLSGVALACGTPWGLFLHRWVAVKFWAVVAAVVAAPLLNKPALTRVEDLLAAGAPVAEVQASAVVLALVCPVIPSVVLGVAVISYTKPWGRTRRGQRLAGGPRRTAGGRRPGTDRKETAPVG